MSSGQTRFVVDVAFDAYIRHKNTEYHYGISEIVQFDFSQDASELIIEYHKPGSYLARLILKCQSTHNITEIIISECALTARAENKHIIRTYSFGYVYKFKKDTIYEIAGYELKFFKKGDKSGDDFQVRISNVLIQPQCWNKKCEWKFDESISEIAYFDTPKVVQPCESDGQIYTSVIDTCVFYNKYLEMAYDLLKKHQYEVLLTIVVIVFIIYTVIVVLIVNCCWRCKIARNDKDEKALYQQETDISY
ncbi:hypothetical protein RF11_04970 [Thelohanellus kitauei]|uniref:Uncharacterized protein n=1 Tax=Thelohanellus kitauei TaxID=669202 RepID=A0A0C2J918_THEKT|nr:hypothetical protein RF11_04970 [Thelohanellus kitauei]